MKNRLLTFLVVALAFLALDSIWLGLTNAVLYRRHLDGLLIDGFRPIPAVLFYLLYVAGLMVFAVEPARAAGRVSRAVGLGAFFGLVAYATYDLTNLATLKTWSVLVTGLDMAWGATASATAATIGVLFAGRFSRS